MDNGFRCGQSVIKWIPWDKVRIHKKSASEFNQHVEKNARRIGSRLSRRKEKIMRLGSRCSRSPIGVVLSSNRLVSFSSIVRDSPLLGKDSPGINYHPVTLSRRSNPSRYFFAANAVTKKPLLVASGISKNLLLPLSKAQKFILPNSVAKPLTKDVVISTEGN